MTLALTRSARPFPAPLPTETRYLLVDGAFFPEGGCWFDDHGATDTLIPVLADGQYDALAAMGPLLIPLPDDCGLACLWQQQNERLRTGAILQVTCSELALTHWLRARLQIRLPDGRVVWFRLGDATILKRLLDNASQAPVHFWPGVSQFSIGTGYGFHHYQCTDTGATPIVADLVEPRFHFTGALAATLGHSTATDDMEVL